MSSCMVETWTVKDVVKKLESQGMKIEGSLKEGFLTIYDANQKVYQALRKGTSVAWMVSYWNSDRVNWSSGDPT